LNPVHPARRLVDCGTAAFDRVPSGFSLQHGSDQYDTQLREELSHAASRTATSKWPLISRTNAVQTQKKFIK
jgi:hypothetical protein